MKKSIYISAVLFCLSFTKLYTQNTVSNLNNSIEINNQSDILSTGRLPDNPNLILRNEALPLEGNGLLTNVTIYGVDMGDRNYIRFETDTLDNLNILSPWPGTLQNFTNASEIVFGDNNHMYEIDKNGDARKVSLIDGSYSFLGNIGIYPLAMALDYSSGVYYVSTEYDWLYSVDIENLTCTAIGSFAYSGWSMIGITCDGNGNLYGYDLSSDNLWSINKATGAATLIGSIGFDANFGQGMAYDQINDQVVLSAFNYDSFRCELRRADLITGNTTLVGPIGTPSATQVTTICLPVNWVDTDENNKHAENYLRQNCPNPFQEKTAIIYKLQGESFVDLMVFDVNGREIKTLVNKKQAPGEYEVEFDAQELQPGIYNCRLSVEKYSQTKKMILMR